jgi:hypothetical protein
VLKHLRAKISSQIGLWPFTTGQNWQIKSLKNSKVCHVTFLLTPPPPYPPCDIWWHFGVKIKQWPLASKFSKFEYSPDIRHFWRIRVLAKMAFLEMCRTRQTRRHLPTWFDRTRQTRQIWWMFWDTTNGTQMSKLIWKNNIKLITIYGTRITGILFDLMKQQQIGYNLWNTDDRCLIWFDETTTNRLQFMEHRSLHFWISE